MGSRLKAVILWNESTVLPVKLPVVSLKNPASPPSLSILAYLGPSTYPKEPSMYMAVRMITEMPRMLDTCQNLLRV